ncbi:uncharacterized protein A4U43_C08F18070 [Asparagus officinalis]|nr:uncharacterized protein A4U43_C08F18070 [Asparagus officinalis]
MSSTTPCLQGYFALERSVMQGKMQDKMINHCKVTLNIGTCHIILDGLCKNKCIHEALNLFERMFSRKYTINTEAFNIMTNGMFRVRRTQATKDLFSDMLAKELLPDVVTYKIMIQGLIKKVC